MYGSFSEDALQIWDFVRCQRPDGTIYGTRGKCKKGTEIGAKEIEAAKPKKAAAKKALANATPEQLQKLAASSKVSPAQKKVIEQELEKKTGKAPKPEAKPKAESNETKVAKLKAEAEKLKAAFAKHQEKGEWEKADAAISKATAINKELDKLTQASKKSQEKTKQAQKEEKDPQEELKKAQAAYTKIAKQQAKLVGEGKIKEAEALKAKKDKAIAAMKKAEEKVNADPKVAKEKEVVDRLRKDVATAGKRQEEYNKRQDETNLSPKQKAAIRSYTDEPAAGTFGYRQLNECSRTPPFCEDPKQAKKLQKDLDDTLKALPKNDNGDPFFRGVFVGGGGGPTAKLYEALENAQPGQRFKDPAFGSFSSDFTTAGDFAGSGRSIVFVSRSKQLTPVNRFSTISDENEALLPRGTEQTIRSVTKLKDQLIVELD
jgi:hypothetical protein